MSTKCATGVLRPCNNCGNDNWEYQRDTDCGDWEEEVYTCKTCGHTIYVELPD